MRVAAHGAGILRDDGAVLAAAAADLEEQTLRPLYRLATQQRREAHAIERLRLRQGHAREVEQRRQHIDVLSDLRHAHSRLDFSRPTDEAGHALSALEEAALATAHAAVESRCVRAVVGGEHHDGVFGEPERIELREHPAHVGIEILDHRVNSGGLRFEAQLGVFREQVLRCLHGRVTGIEGHITEKRLRSMFLHEAHRRVREHVRDETLPRCRDAIVLQFGIEVVREEAAHEAKKLIKALTACRGGMIRTIVPFAETAAHITRRFQCLCERHFLTVHGLQTRGRIQHAESEMMAPGEHGSARGRADRADVKMLQFHALVLELVERRRGELVVAMATQIAPAHVISEDEEDVWRLGGRGSSPGKERKEDEETGECMLHWVYGIWLELSRALAKPAKARSTASG